MSKLKLLPAIKMDPRERKILNDNLKQTVPYVGAEEGIDITGFHLTVDQWDDLRFPATQTRRGALDKPDFDFTNVGLLFPRNDATEVIYVVCQMPHGYKYGTALRPHIHFVQTSALVPTFKIDYKWYDIGDPIPGAFTTITSTGSVAVPWVSGSIHQLLMFPEIPGTGISEVSSILDLKIYRDDNVVVGDVLVKEFDLHYRFDTLGSLEEATK